MENDQAVKGLEAEGSPVRSFLCHVQVGDELLEGAPWCEARGQTWAR